ncbi:MAG: FliI/YscN family ATPase [Planctomycetota bacterium]
MTDELLVDIEACREHIRAASRPSFRGKVDIVSGVLVEAAGIPAAVGELCRIDRGPAGPIVAEVVGFRGASTLLMPHGDLEGVAPRQEVTALGRPFTVQVDRALLGCVLDGFGCLVDGRELPAASERRRVRAEAPPPLTRRPITGALQTGVRAIDGLLTLGRGQRLGIFAGSGVGKSTLLSQVARGTDADVRVVCLVGERGREVRSFLEQALDDATRARTVVVAATSDRPPIERFLAPFTALTIAEYFRDLGQDALLVMDSVTRFAGAAREIGLAAGEPPTVRGYPPSFFATVPKLIERMGTSDRGSITGLITVLLDGDDPNEPVADTLRGLLDGHVLLSRDIAQRGQFPAIDVLGSLSRLMDEIVDEPHLARARRLRRVLATWQEGRDLIEIGAYKPGTNPDLDAAVQIMPSVQAFLAQGTRESTGYEQTLQLLAALFPHEAAG